MARLILDVMGGDKAPQSILQGAVLALNDLKKAGASLVLVGRGRDKLDAAVATVRDFAGETAIDVGFVTPDEKLSRTPPGVTRKIDTGTCCPRLPL